MARRSRRRTTYNYTTVKYANDTPGGQPVLGSILQLIVLFALLAAIVVAVGPVIDYFGFYVSALPADANPYKEAVMPLFPWAYAFIILTGIVGFVYVYRTIIRQITYSRWNE